MERFSLGEDRVQRAVTGTEKTVSTSSRLSAYLNAKNTASAFGVEVGTL